MLNQGLIQKLLKEYVGAVNGEEAAARHLGIEADRIAQALGGDLSHWTLGRLVRLARGLGVDDRIFFGEGGVVPMQLLAFRNDQWGGLDPRDGIIARKALERAATLRSLGWQSHPYKASPLRKGTPYDLGYRLAERVRKDLKSTNEPLTNLTRLVEQRFGIVVAWAEMVTPRMEAMAVAAPGGEAIVLNSTWRPNSIGTFVRRNIAHELCHILFDVRRSQLLVKSDMDSAFSMEKDDMEKRANAFAAELLVPKAGVELCLQGRPKVIQDPQSADTLTTEVANHFGAPWLMTAWHLRNRGFIDKEKAGDPPNFTEGTANTAGPWSAPRERSTIEDFAAAQVEAGLLGRLRAQELSEVLTWAPGTKG